MKKTIFSKAVAFTAAFGLVATAFSAQSFAAETTGESTTTITGGSLTGGDIQFNTITGTLDGTRTTGEANWNISKIVNARGTGASWSLQLTLSQFQEVDSSGAVVSDGYIFNENSLKVKTSPVITQFDDSSSNPSDISTVATGVALDTGSPVQIISAGENEGMGSFEVSDLGVELSIPANAYARTYKATATVTLNETP
ncbi:WxL domain-containing protein [Caldibacillus lycopersici]|uniref:WxL domain-containing protein n=1 Tax=Perspicuibacillus lycopersici TaxID=1325689 RepID=A0AAE3ISG3_9BACI|nr:WxL domain-containing protein [Perspicuibacillus lycopersici]MCU9612576.1 WxL domain-containing protein [Perspicuibacillus lycopersici]